LRAQHFSVTVDRFRSDEADLVNVVGRRIGESTRQLVVVAARDADRVPDRAGSAADTASLMEIARTLEGRVTQKTLVLASLDGSTLGSAGARRFVAQLQSAGPVEAIVVLSDTGVAHARGSLLVPWSETTLRTGLQLQRTVAESLRLELQSGGAGRTPNTLSQFARLAFPVGIGDQAPLIDAGFDALRLSGSGELPPKGQPAPNADRLGSIGRATLRTVFAYDAGGRVNEQPSSFLLIGQKLLPRWSVALLVAALLLPLLAAAVDSFARMRRRHEPVTPWLRWIAAGTVPFLVALAVAEFLVLVGQAPDTPPVPLSPTFHALGGAAALTLGLCALFFIVSWVLIRPRIAGELPAPDGPGAAAALALVLSVAAIAVWVVNPFAALALLPAFHLWLLVTASPEPASRPVGVALVLLGLLIPVLIALAGFGRFHLGPLAGLWYGFLLITGHSVGLYTSVVGVVLLACFGAALRIALARQRAPREPEGVSVRGPGGYAGPGSLGGTESALWR
jgi:TRAP-type C4-dicarboxylate transport system permease small subunit